MLMIFIRRPARRRRSNTLSEDSNDDSEPEDDVSPGVSFWICIDWPSGGIVVFEKRVIKQFLESGFNLKSCKVIRGRGTQLFLYQF